MIQPYELLQNVMSGYQVTPADIDNLVNAKQCEGLHLEYKDARELDEPKKASRTLRQYLSGFANSDGGIIIFGINESEWQIDNCTAPGGKPLDEWAATVASSMAGYFSPPPRFQIVQHTDGNLLIAATERSLALIPCIVEGVMVHFLRFHDETLENKTLRIPDYLWADLVLGQRQKPLLEIASTNIEAIERYADTSYEEQNIGFNVAHDIGNMGLSWAEGVRLAHIGWEQQRLFNTVPIHKGLEPYLDIGDHNLPGVTTNWALGYRRSPKHDLEGLDEIRMLSCSLYLPWMRRFAFLKDYQYESAIGLISKTTVPVWYQLTVKVNDDLFKKAFEKDNNVMGSYISLQRCVGIRPRISISPLHNI